MKKKKMKLYKKIILLFLFLILVISIITVYAYYLGSKGLKVREYTIVDNKIPTSFYGFKILQFSDLHYQASDYNHLKKLINKINDVKPDLVIFTGDLLYNKLSYKNQNILIEQLSKIKNTIGKYYISGDNDINNPQSSVILTKAGFSNLDDNCEPIYYNDNEYILLTGISSISNKIDSNDKVKNTDNFLKNLDKSRSPSYQLLLLHEPDLVDDIDLDNYDMILAGHNHNGQIKFLEHFFLPDNGKNYYKPYQKVKKKSLYISNGIGNELVPFRLFNQPSINLYRLKNK